MPAPVATTFTPSNNPEQVEFFCDIDNTLIINNQVNDALIESFVKAGITEIYLCSSMSARDPGKAAGEPNTPSRPDLIEYLEKKGIHVKGLLSTADLLLISNQGEKFGTFEDFVKQKIKDGQGQDTPDSIEDAFLQQLGLKEGSQEQKEKALAAFKAKYSEMLELLSQTDAPMLGQMYEQFMKPFYGKTISDKVNEYQKDAAYQAVLFLENHLLTPGLTERKNKEIETRFKNDKPDAIQEMDPRFATHYEKQWLVSELLTAAEKQGTPIRRFIMVDDAAPAVMAVPKAAQGNNKAAGMLIKATDDKVTDKKNYTNLLQEKYQEMGLKPPAKKGIVANVIEIIVKKAKDFFTKTKSLALAAPQVTAQKNASQSSDNINKINEKVDALITEYKQAVLSGKKPEYFIPIMMDLAAQKTKLQQMRGSELAITKIDEIYKERAPQILPSAEVIDNKNSSILHQVKAFGKNVKATIAPTNRNKADKAMQEIINHMNKEFGPAHDHLGTIITDLKNNGGIGGSTYEQYDKKRKKESLANTQPPPLMGDFLEMSIHYPSVEGSRDQLVIDTMTKYFNDEKNPLTGKPAQVREALKPFDEIIHNINTLRIMDDRVKAAEKELKKNPKNADKISECEFLLGVYKSNESKLVNFLNNTPEPFLKQLGEKLKLSSNTMPIAELDSAPKQKLK